MNAKVQAITNRPASEVPTVRVVIVNYRTAELTIDCLASLQPEVEALGRDGLAAVTVDLVDGGSGDDSPERLHDAIAQQGWGGWVNLIVSPENRGFAGGNNAAIVPALAEDRPPDFVLMLNPDTLVRPGALRELLGFMHDRPEVSIAGSRLEDLDPPTPQRTAFRFPSIFSEFESVARFGPISRLLSRRLVAPAPRDERFATDWVCGASMIVRREVFDAIGPLDDGYFMYYEETDFCLAAQRAGFACWYVPESRVVHLVGKASGVTGVVPKGQRRKRRPAYWFDSRRRYFLKNHGKVYAAATDAVWIVTYTLHSVRVALTGIHEEAPTHYLRDFIRHSVFGKGFRL